MLEDVYEQLIELLLENTYLTEETAREVVSFLSDEDLVDYDVLKEYFRYYKRDEDIDYTEDSE